jgi:hypothetical protein
VRGLERELDRLFGLPLAELTSEWNELARRLKSAGDREGAEQARALTKPSVAAWAVNQLSRREQLRPPQVAAAQGAGESRVGRAAGCAGAARRGAAAGAGGAQAGERAGRARARAGPPRRRRARRVHRRRPVARSAYEAWLDERDTARPLTRAELHSRSDDIAAAVVASGGGIGAVVEATDLRTCENVLRLIDPAGSRPGRRSGGGSSPAVHGRLGSGPSWRHQQWAHPTQPVGMMAASGLGQWLTHRRAHRAM